MFRDLHVNIEVHIIRFNVLLYGKILQKFTRDNKRMGSNKGFNVFTKFTLERNNLLNLKHETE